MSDQLAGNPHAVEAAEWVAEAPKVLQFNSAIDPPPGERALVVAGLAQAEAALALAHEQRTANLIAWATANGAQPRQDVQDYIESRLGLGDAK